MNRRIYYTTTCPGCGQQHDFNPSKPVMCGGKNEEGLRVGSESIEGRRAAGKTVGPKRAGNQAAGRSRYGLL